MLFVPHRTLAICCAMLAALVCLENWPERMTPGSPLPVRMALRRDAPARPRRQAEEMAQAILARPLFSAQRRPQAASKAKANAAAALPRLSGIVVVGNYRRAIFERSGKASILAVGDRVDAAHVVAISADAVTIGDVRGNQTIRPGYDPARPLPAGTTLSILERLNLHQTKPVALPKPPSLQQFMRRLGPH